MDIVLAIIGVILLIKGNVRVTSKSEVSKAVGRTIGVIAVLPFIINFLAGLLGFERPADTLIGIMYGIVILVVLVAAIFFRKPLQPTS